jgi:hypothetical protein
VQVGTHQPALLVGPDLTIANAAETNGLMCVPKHGGARDNKFLVTHPMTDQRYLQLTDRTPKRTDRGAIELLEHIEQYVLLLYS